MLSTLYEFRAGIAIPLSQPRSNVCQILSQAHTHTPSEVSGFRLWLSQSGIEHGGGLISTASECSLNDALWVMECVAPLFVSQLLVIFIKTFVSFFFFFFTYPEQTRLQAYTVNILTPLVCAWCLVDGQCVNICL